MANYKKHVAFISLGVLSLLLISTAIFINYNERTENNGNSPNNTPPLRKGCHLQNEQIDKQQTNRGKGCSGGSNKNATINATVANPSPSPDYDPEDTFVEEVKENDDGGGCGCHCSKDDGQH
jgi:hypothetical protein